MRSLLPLPLLVVSLTLFVADASALTAGEASCRDAIAKSVARYAAAAAQSVERCHRARSSGDRSLDDDCNVVAEADSGGALAKARDKGRVAIVSSCIGDEALLGDYPSCPAPAATADDGGATSGIDNFAELAACFFALTDAHVGSVGASSEGSPSSRLLDPLRKCQAALGKGSDRLLRTTLAERRRCQQAADRTEGGGYACDGADPRGRIAAAEARFVSRVGPACDFPPDVLGDLEACADDRAALLECAAASAADHGSALIRSVYDLEEPATTTTTLPGSTSTTLAGTACGDTAPQCNGSCPSGTSCQTSGSSCACMTSGTGRCAPATIRRAILSRFSESVHSVTGLNAGWSGLAVDIDVPDRAGDLVDVVCDDNCENCTVSLHRDAATGVVSGCTCTSSPDTGCTVINGSDPDHCGSLDPTCRCYFGAPLPIVSAGNPACVGLRIRRDYSGTMNLRTGEWSDTLNIAAVVYLGLDTGHPCPTCDGDPVPNDGVRGGTCSGGIGGGACDANGTHPTFGTLSNDCLPASASNISGTGLLIDLNLSTSTVSLAANLPCDTPAGEKCACRTCTGNSLLSCSSDAQCADAGAGTCTAAGGAGVRKNQCDGFACGPDGDCATGPIDTYCDGATYPDGRGYFPCTTDSDCSTNSAGSCTIQEIRHCFPDPIVYSGTPDRYGPTSVSAFCVAPTSNPAINIASGLPGPGALLLTFDNDVRCKSDPGLAYEFPDGANCGDDGGGVTTTTLLPLPSCADATSPVCGGICPPGQTCGDSGGTCTCTGIPLPACEDAAAPLCGGFCANTSDVCTATGGTCACATPTLPQCSDATAPVCGGLCPTGEVCASVGDSCECGAPGLPACGTAISPTCAGICDVGQACVDQGGTCGCLQLPLPTCSETTPPLCEGTCSLGSTCGAVGDACQCTPLPIP